VMSSAGVHLEVSPMDREENNGDEDTSLTLRSGRGGSQHVKKSQKKGAGNDATMKVPTVQNASGRVLPNDTLVSSARGEGEFLNCGDCASRCILQYYRLLRSEIFVYVCMQICGTNLFSTVKVSLLIILLRHFQRTGQVHAGNQQPGKERAQTPPLNSDVLSQRSGKEKTRLSSPNINRRIKSCSLSNSSGDHVERESLSRSFTGTDSDDLRESSRGRRQRSKKKAARTGSDYFEGNSSSKSAGVRACT